MGGSVRAVTVSPRLLSLCAPPPPQPHCRDNPHKAAAAAAGIALRPLGATRNNSHGPKRGPRGRRPPRGTAAPGAGGKKARGGGLPAKRRRPANLSPLHPPRAVGAHPLRGTYLRWRVRQPLAGLHGAAAAARSVKRGRRRRGRAALPCPVPRPAPPAPGGPGRGERRGRARPTCATPASAAPARPGSARSSAGSSAEPREDAAAGSASLLRAALCLLEVLTLSPLRLSRIDHDSDFLFFFIPLPPLCPFKFLLSPARPPPPFSILAFPCPRFPIRLGISQAS